MITQWVNKFLIKPYELKSGMAAAVKVVAVVGGAGDWAAYLGQSDQSDYDVAKYGDTMDRDAAELLFPTFAKVLEYRL